MNPADLRELRERDERIAVRDPRTGFFKVRRKRPIGKGDAKRTR